jgi:hypothetical protein
MYGEIGCFNDEPHPKILSGATKELDILRPLASDTNRVRQPYDP